MVLVNLTTWFGFLLGAPRQLAMGRDRESGRGTLGEDLGRLDLETGGEGEFFFFFVLFFFEAACFFFFFRGSFFFFWGGGWW